MKGGRGFLEDWKEFFEEMAVERAVFKPSLAEQLTVFSATIRVSHFPSLNP